MHTNRLHLIPATPSLLKAAIKGRGLFAEALLAEVPAHWTEFGTGPLQWALDKLTEAPADAGWLTWFPIYKEDNLLIGSGGYKGQPNDAGEVEIGYEIIPAYRGRGLATEMAHALVKRAFSFNAVSKVLAHTLAQPNASTAILIKLGFIHTAEFENEEDGLIWRWELDNIVF